MYEYKQPMARQYEKIYHYLSEIKKDIMVLDVGAGEGGIQEFLPDNITYHTLDFGLQHTYNFDLNKGFLPIKSEIYDVVICTETLEHIYFPKQILREIKRVGKKNCKFFISMPNEYNFVQRLYYLFGHKTNFDMPFEIIEKHLHIHKPRVRDILDFVGQELKIENIDFIWQTRNQSIVARFINGILDILSKIMPSLFSRLVLVRAVKG